MKKTIITMVAMMAIFTCKAQEKMVVEMKNGNTYSYRVDDIGRFYFTTEEEYANYCEVEVEDETVMTKDAIFELDYDIDVEYIRFLFFEADLIRTLNNDQIVDALKNNPASGQMDKSKTLLLNNRLEEGTEYALACMGFNAENQNGAPMVYFFKTKVEAEELFVNVENPRYDNDYFYYDTVIDDDKILEYYILTETGFNFEKTTGSPASIGHAWKRMMKEDEEKAGQHYIGESLKEPRTNGATDLRIVTWARDFDLKFSGIIRENLLKINASSRQLSPVKPSKAKRQEIQCFSKDEFLEHFQLRCFRVR